MRPAITLYGQQAGEEECRIGEMQAKDLDKGPDCLIVFGTSLKVSKQRASGRIVCRERERSELEHRLASATSWRTGKRV